MRNYFDRKSVGRLRKKRRQQGRLKTILRLVFFILAIAGGLYGYRYCLAAGVFNIKQVNIRGNRMIAAESISNIADSLNGKIIWNSEYRNVAAIISKKYPAIKRTNFRVWPWGIVEIIVNERKPLAELSHDRSLMMDSEGMIFKAENSIDSVSGSDKPRLPQLKTTGASSIGIWRALRLIEAAPWAENDWLFDPSDESDINLLLPGGVAVHFGNGAFEQGWKKLGETLTDLGKENLAAREIDLRFKDQAIFKEQIMAQSPSNVKKTIDD